MHEFENKFDGNKIEKSDFLLLKTVMDLLPNAMSIKDKNLERVAVNQAFVDLSGYSKHQLLGESKLDIQSSETKTSINYDKQVLATQKSNNHIEKIVNPQGKNRWVEIQKSFFQTETGEEYVISILTDVTELKLREFELVASKKKTYQKSLQRSRFLANMGHDIREPLRGIIGMTGLLRDSKLDAHQADAVALLGRASDALMRILDDVVDFAKIDGGVMKIQQTPFELRELIEGLADVLGLPARDKRIDLIVSIDSHLPEIFFGDTVRIRQILMNLIENAIKFTSEGFVSINVSGHIHNKTTKLEFTVKDSGPGIPPDKLAGLFHSIENDEKTQRISGISGLGLSLCQKLAKLMGGALEGESVEGIGSVFTLILPLEFKIKPEVSQSVQTLLTNGNHLSHKILFVDDIKENYDAVLPYLSAHGLISDYAQSAASAVQLLNNALLGGRPYTLIFIDYNMPITDGLLLTASLRGSQNYSKATIVILSSVNDSEIHECFMSHNISHYLTKPILKKDIESVLTNTADIGFLQAS